MTALNNVKVFISPNAKRRAGPEETSGLVCYLPFHIFKYRMLSKQESSLSGCSLKRGTYPSVLDTDSIVFEIHKQD